ncbi:MAG: glutathione transferase GstA [Panacagrimonas sp.]
MKLFYFPGACSLSPHIVLREVGAKFDLVKVDLAAKKTEAGDDYLKINPRGYVPALQLDDGSVLVEGPAIVQYLADQNPSADLAPAPTDRKRYELQGWLTFIGTEIHKQFSPLFNPNSVEPQKAASIENLKRRFAYVAQELSARPYLMGDKFSVADVYLFVVLGWAGHVKLDLSPWPALGAYLGRIAARPAVQAALKAEGLA